MTAMLPMAITLRVIAGIVMDSIDLNHQGDDMMMIT
jgi:hypothetical protein